MAMAAVSNLGRDDNYTGHPFAAVNLFTYGLMAWDPDQDPGDLIRLWCRLTYCLPCDQENLLHRLLMNSRRVYEKYTAPLGLCWMVEPHVHYGPSPMGYEYALWGTYNRANRDAVGIDRTRNGTGYLLQYPDEMQKKYEDAAACPDELKLFEGAGKIVCHRKAVAGDHQTIHLGYIKAKPFLRNHHPGYVLPVIVGDDGLF